VGSTVIAAGPIMAGAMVGVSDSTSLPDRETVAPLAPVSFENGQVRELEPPAALVTEPVASGPGVAVAAPVNIEWPSDLQQVESDPHKVAAFEQPEAEQQAPMPRPKRARQAAQPMDDEPLVQIETGADAAPGGIEDKTPAAPR